MGEKLKLDCTGCGASLFQTENPQIYVCEKCDTSFKVKFDSDGIDITAIEKKIGDVKRYYLIKEEVKQIEKTFGENKKIKKTSIGCFIIGVVFAMSFIASIFGLYHAVDEEKFGALISLIFTGAVTYGSFWIFFRTEKGLKKYDGIKERKAMLEKEINDFEN